RQTDELRKRVHEQELQEEMEAKKKVKEDLIETLMQASENVHRVIESDKTRIEGLEAKREQLQSIQLNLPKNDEVQPLYEYVKPIDDPHGPTLADSSDFDRLGYLNNVRREKPSEQAGGYTSIVLIRKFVRRPELRQNNKTTIRQIHEKYTLVYMNIY
ncbi:unnamed protein product, partial [Didymodactylos carnosus]